MYFSKNYQLDLTQAGPNFSFVIRGDLHIEAHFEYL